MMPKPKDILPLKGYSQLLFGEDIDQIVQKIGEADQIDQIEGAEPGSMVLHYNNPEMALFFEGYGSSILAFIETTDNEATLFGKQVFKLRKDEIIALMAANGYDEVDSSKENGGELLSFDLAMIDFYFIKNELNAVSWGVILNDNGAILHL